VQIKRQLVVFQRSDRSTSSAKALQAPKAILSAVDLEIPQSAVEQTSESDNRTAGKSALVTLVDGAANDRKAPFL
jgi:hypothetical protein